MKKVVSILVVVALAAGAFWYFKKQKAQEEISEDVTPPAETGKTAGQPYHGPEAGVMGLNIIKLGELLTVDLDIPKENVDGGDLEKLKAIMGGLVEFKTSKNVEKLTKDTNLMTPNKACEYSIETFNPNKVRNEGKPYVAVELNFSCGSIPTELDVGPAFKALRIKQVEMSLINEDKSDKRTLAPGNSKVGL